MKKVLKSWVFYVVLLFLAGVVYHYFVVRSGMKVQADKVAAFEKWGNVIAGNINSAHERLDEAAKQMTAQMTALKAEVDGKVTKAELAEVNAQVYKLDGRIANTEANVAALDEKVNPPAATAYEPDEKVSAEPEVTVAEVCEVEYTKLGFSAEAAQAACQ